MVGSVLNNMCVLTKPRGQLQTLCPAASRIPVTGPQPPQALGTNCWAGPRGLASSSPATAHVLQGQPRPAPQPPGLPSAQRDSGGRGVSVVPTPRWRMLKSQEPAPAASHSCKGNSAPLGKCTARLFRVKVRRSRMKTLPLGSSRGSPPGKGQATPHPKPSRLPSKPLPHSWPP